MACGSRNKAYTATGKVIARTWRGLLERPSVREVLGPDAEPESEHRAWPIPSHFDPERLTLGRVLFTGDNVLDGIDGPVVLVGHSWGGAVITQAGNDPKVKALVFVAALPPKVGESVGDLVGSHPSPPGLS